MPPHSFAPLPPCSEKPQAAFPRRGGFLGAPAKCALCRFRCRGNAVRLEGGQHRRSPARPRVAAPPSRCLPRSVCSEKTQGRCVVRFAHPCVFPLSRSRRLVFTLLWARASPRQPPQDSYFLVCGFPLRRLRPRPCLLGRRRRSRRLRRRWVLLLGRLCDCRRWRTRSPCALAA